jgi:hypothetical protein
MFPKLFVLSVAILCTLVAALPALAATDDPADTSTANLVNLNYYLHPGDFLAEDNFSGSIHEYYGSNVETFSTQAFAFQYGLPVDGLRFGAGVSLMTTTDAVGTANTVYSHTGSTDPTFQLNYRIFDNPADGLSLDLEVQYSPKVGTDTVAFPNSSGSNYKGYSSLLASAGLFWRTGTNELELAATGSRFFDQTAENPDGSIDFTSAGVWNEDISLQDRYHVTPRFFVQPRAEAVFATTYTQVYTNAFVSTYTNPFHVDGELVAGYLVGKQVLLTAHLLYLAYTNTSAGVPLQKFADASWGVSATIEF